MAKRATSKSKYREFPNDPGAITNAAGYERRLEENLTVPQANYRIPAITVRNKSASAGTLVINGVFTYDVPAGATDTYEPGVNHITKYEYTPDADTADGEVQFLERGKPWNE